jgi:NitT/TauT family transport system permease protein
MTNLVGMGPLQGLPGVRKAGRYVPFLYGMASIISLVLLWEGAAAAGLTFTLIIPPPSRFIHELIVSHYRIGLGAQASSIPASILSSLFRVLVGLLCGFATAIVAGALLSLNRTAYLLIAPIVRVMAPIAPIAWIPLGLLIFGIGNQTAIFIVFMGVFFTLTIATLQAIDYVPESLLDNARCLGATQWQTWMNVIVPSILPNVFTALRINFVSAWMAVLAAEMTGLQDGLGAIIMIGRNLFDNNLILLGMCLIGIAGFLGDLLLRYIQGRFLWWGAK